MTYLTTLLMSMFITISLIPIFKTLAFSMNAVDIPNDRKVHASPMPKIGGIAMALGMLAPSLLWLPATGYLKSILMGSLIIVIFGIIDDIKDLAYKVKFAGQIGAAFIAVHVGDVSIKTLGNLAPEGFILPDIVSFPLTLLIIVGVTNAINLSDGLDGLAGGITLLGFLCISYIAFSIGNPSIAIISISVVGAIFGFLRFNTFPASVFMGDTGSQLLGFLAITLSIVLSQSSPLISPLFPLVILGFPILDTLAVMTERLIHGHSPFKADKRHFHHKLMDIGLTHSESVCIIYLIQSALVTLAYIFRFYSEWYLLITYMLFASAVITGFYVAEKNGFHYSRTGISDIAFKGKIKQYPGKQLIIKFSFISLKFLFPLVVIATCFIPTRLPGYIGFSFPVMIILIIICKLLPKNCQNTFMKYCFYITIPFLIYFTEQSLCHLDSKWFGVCYDISFGIISLFLILTLKFTRRKKGFKTTPLDFLILFVTLFLPLIITLRIADFNLMKLTVKAIVFLFSYEVITGEFRGKTVFLNRITVSMMFIFMARAVFQNI